MRLINADRLIMELLDLWQYYLERKRAKETMIIWTVITRVNEMAIEEMWKHELSKEHQRTSNAHPTHECVKPTHECVDLISRQAVLEGKTAIDAIKNLPSAQPEIIRCKNCKHLQKWRSEESAKKFGQIYECVINVLTCPKPDDFCSCGERREVE